VGTNNITSAIKDITEFLDDLKIPYMLIGGIANSIQRNFKLGICFKNNQRTIRLDIR
jgi:hypothetical protein